MASFTASDISVNDLIASAMTRLQKVWNQVGTDEASRTSVQNQLKINLEKVIGEVEASEIAIRDGKMHQIQAAISDYNKKASMLQKTSVDIDNTRENESLIDAVFRTEESVAMISEEFQKVVAVHENLLSNLHSLYDTLNGKNQPYKSEFENIGQVLSEERQSNIEEEIKIQSNEKQLRVTSRSSLVSEVSLNVVYFFKLVHCLMHNY